MSERERATRIRALPHAGFAYAINQHAINQQVLNRATGIYVTSLVLTITQIGATAATARDGFGAIANAFPEMQRLVFSALFVLAMAGALKRNQRGRVHDRQNLKLRPAPNDNIPATLNAAQEILHCESSDAARLTVVESCLRCAGLPVRCLGTSFRKFIQKLHGRPATAVSVVLPAKTGERVFVNKRPARAGNGIRSAPDWPAGCSTRAALFFEPEWRSHCHAATQY
jgi:hypothetical protein